MFGSFPLSSSTRRIVRDAYGKHAGARIIRLFGKKSSFETIQNGLPEFYPRLWRFCYGLTGTRDRADDLAQTTAARALDRHAQFVPGTHLDRWLFVMARRLWLNEMRSETVRLGGGLVATDVVADDKPDVLVNILASEVLHEIMNLPEAQREAVMLVYVEGYSYAEASEMFEIPIGTVMSRLAAARKKLAVALSDDTRIAGQ